MQGNPVHPMTSNRAEFLDGFRMVLPILIVPTAFSFIVGAASVQKGLSPLEATLMSMGVFAGGGQMLALEVWHDPRAWLLVMLAAVSINVRFALQAASVQRKINHFSFWQRWLAISTLTDPAWGMSEVRHLTRQVTFAFIMGITAPIYLIWAGGTLAGAVLGKLLEDPRVYGLDYAFTVVFIALALPFWKRSGRCCLRLLPVGWQLPPS
jgi:4-azaleucine resistance transporter AzlC